VLVQEAIAVNRRVLDVEYRHFNKRLKHLTIDEDDDNHTTDEYEYTDDERSLILSQAYRMKRMSAAFRRLQQLQGKLMKEVQECMADIPQNSNSKITLSQTDTVTLPKI
jgi:hypothetical protein